MKLNTWVLGGAIAAGCVAYVYLRDRQTPPPYAIAIGLGGLACIARGVMR